MFQLAQRFSYVLPEPTLLEVLTRYSPLVELGAGTGYWAYLLRSLGADVIAYDTAPLGGSRPNRYHGDVRPWSDVQPADERVVANHPLRSLFLCWPPRYSSLWQCLDHYAGHHVLCIADSGHRTPRLGRLPREFDLIERHPATAMEPEPGTTVELRVWRRRDFSLSPDNPRRFR